MHVVVWSRARHVAFAHVARVACGVRVRVAALLAFVALALLLAGPLARPAHALELHELAAQAGPSVLLLRVLDGTGREVARGTGFVVAEGRIATNAHVVEGATAVEATLADGKKLPVRGVLARDERNDLALLAFDGGALAPLPLGSSESLKQGDEIAVIGCPVGLSPSLSTGIVSALRRNAPLERDPALEAWLVQITAPISPGSSGSPVMTRDGNVIGVAVGKVRMGENVNFAVPVERLRALVDGVPGGASPTPFAEPRAAGRLVRNLVISTLVFVVPFGIYAIVAWRRRARGGGGRGGEPARSRLLH